MPLLGPYVHWPILVLPLHFLHATGVAGSQIETRGALRC